MYVGWLEEFFRKQLARVMRLLAVRSLDLARSNTSVVRIQHKEYLILSTLRWGVASG